MSNISAMDEARRLIYLKALGIQRWQSRDRHSPALAATAEVSEAEENLTSYDQLPVPVAPPPLASATTDPASVASLGWPELEARVRACQACSLHRTRTQTVFGVGNRDADLLIVGEAPGADEDRQGEPFVGRAGQLLTAMLRAIGLRREDVYIANILKCRPPGNRNPSLEEVAACQGFLQRQIALTQPKLMLAVGAVSARNLLNTDEPVGRLRRRLHHYGDGQVPLLVTYHPAYLLRRPEEKAKAWEDLQEVMRRLNPV